MQTISIMGAATKGYRFLWESRSYLRHFLIPIISLKFICIAAVFLLGLENNLLRQGLTMLPSSFADAWLAVNIIRMAFFGEPFFSNIQNIKKGKAINEYRSRIMMAGILLYVLIDMGNWLLMTGLYNFLPQPGNMPDGDMPEQTLTMFFISLALLGALIWSFRLKFLYAAMTMGYGVKNFLLKIRGMGSSFYLIGIWILCYIPMTFCMILIVDGLSNLLNLFGVDLVAIASSAKIIYIVMESITDVLMVVILSVAGGYGILSLMHGAENNQKEE